MVAPPNRAGGTTEQCVHPDVSVWAAENLLVAVLRELRGRQWAPGRVDSLTDGGTSRHCPDGLV
jgi:hypothetical protein